MRVVIVLNENTVIIKQNKKEFVSIRKENRIV